MGQQRRPPRRSDGGVSVDVPGELDWYLWRPIVHERRLATLRDLDEHHGLDDLREMHLALDVLDELESKIAEEQKRRNS